MAEFTIPTGYTLRKTKDVGDITYLGYSEIEEPTSGKWVVKKIEIVADETNFSYGEGSFDDYLTLDYK